ncbi:leucine--tRNA ligase [Candidatus Peregrinibacteria bacterium]|jgi:leucyl-tRNA synthetase|nr:leucine--tRNA ligase [Candidatus Peregrinibacteria bacterium]
MPEIKNYDHKTIEKKWQKAWEKQKLFRAILDEKKEKYYVLDMFPYPSGAGLHVGHPEGYTATDIISHYKRKQGFNVLHPMGWDAFGLPAENYAIKTGIHPEKSTADNIATFTKQIKSLGFSYDWEREINTTDPDYYKWSQWIFLELYKKGLAYEKEMQMSWCSTCKIVAANEEVENGVHERCGNPVEKRNMKQWMFKITEYADRLLEDLDDLDWEERIKEMQRNWIGKSYGAEVKFKVEGLKFKVDIPVYTTRPDTLFGCTYMVLAPEHSLVKNIVTQGQKNKVEQYMSDALNKSEKERKQDEKEKTGVFTGSYAINPVNNKKVPIWIADYVLMGYGTGAIMAVPAHDERDNEFAKKYEIEIIEVIQDITGSHAKTFRNYTMILDGVAKNSDFLNGLPTEEAIEKMIQWLEEKGFGKRQTNYKLRDWVFTRQRYWGEPIPLIHCEKCGVVPLNEEDLPLKLPETNSYHPTEDGQSPLAKLEDWVSTKCPKCSGTAKRETSTMPNWAGSSWYWLRFMDPKNSNKAWSKEAEKYWGMVDLYVGGAEHAVLHLLYARFWHKVLYDLGCVSNKEPFQKLRNQGMILAFSYKDENGKYYHPNEVWEENGEYYVIILHTPLNSRDKLHSLVLVPSINRDTIDSCFSEETKIPVSKQIEKMSKSKLNVVNPDEVVEEYGADTLRLYEMFMGPFEQTVVWDPKGIVGVYRFLEKVWKLRDKVEKPKKKAIIIHGFDSRSDSHWIPKLREKLISEGYYVLTPSMPNADKPKYEEWKTVIDTLGVDENTVLIGHSLGGGFIPRCLSDAQKKVDSIVLVAPTYASKNPNIEKEFGKDFNEGLIKSLVSNIILIHSDKDPKVPSDSFERYTKELSPKVINVPGGEHLGSSQLEKATEAVFSAVSLFSSASVIPAEAGIHGDGLIKSLHKTIKKVREDTENFKFNTAISAMMVFVNEALKEEKIHANIYEDLLQILNPYAPHITEEIWSELGHISSLVCKPLPQYNEEFCKEESITLAVQVNGKVRDTIEVEVGAAKEEILEKAKASENVQKYIESGLKKEIYVPGKLVSLVV